MLIIKLILITAFLIVFLQDYKERQVYWFMFLIVGCLSGFLFYKSTLPELFITSVLLNIGFVGVLVFVMYLYAKLKLRTNLLSTIGLGDLFLFLALAVSFSTISFIVIFISSLIFSLLVHLYVSKHKKMETVPLAGYMSLFFLMSYMFHWSGFVNVVYTL